MIQISPEIKKEMLKEQIEAIEKSIVEAQTLWTNLLKKRNKLSNELRNLYNYKVAKKDSAITGIERVRVDLREAI